MSTDDGGGLRNTLYRTTTRSGRRMTPARRLLYAMAVPLAIGLIRMWWRLCPVVRIEGLQHLDEALARAPSLVPCYWHQHQLYCGKFLVEQRSRGLTPGWLIKWDRFVIPMPFARVAIAIGPPCYVPRVTDAASLARLQQQMEEELKRLYGEARQALERRG